MIGYRNFTGKDGNNYISRISTALNSITDLHREVYDRDYALYITKECTVLGIENISNGNMVSEVENEFGNMNRVDDVLNKEIYRSGSNTYEVPIQFNLTPKPAIEGWSNKNEYNLYWADGYLSVQHSESEGFEKMWWRGQLDSVSEIKNGIFHGIRLDM
jgi:hypothetical protein